jgi:hypothetical protein
MVEFNAYKLATKGKPKVVKSNRDIKAKPKTKHTRRIAQNRNDSLNNTVENLVNDDINADIFFETLNRIFHTETIFYKNTIEDVFSDLFTSGGSREQFKIFPTTISIHNQIDNETSTHSIVLIWNNDILYLYDPNGAYNTQEPGVQGMIQEYGYSCFGQYFNSTLEFQNYITNNYNIDFRVPLNLGAQYLLKIATESSYIGDGGYCMFFNYMAIEYILRNYNNNTNLQDLYITITTSPFSNVFPKPASKMAALNGTARPNTFEWETNRIVNDVFNMYGGKKNRSKKQKGSGKIKTKRKTRKARRK